MDARERDDGNYGACGKPLVERDYDIVRARRWCDEPPYFYCGIIFIYYISDLIQG